MRGLFLICLILMSCKEAHEYKLTDFQECIKSSRNVMKFSAGIQNFTRSFHDIGYFYEVRKKHSWTTYAYFLGRFEITYTVDVKLSDDHKKVQRIIDKPQIILRIFKDISKDGRVATYKKDIKISEEQLSMILKGDDIFTMFQLNKNELKPLDSFDLFLEGQIPPKNFNPQILTE